MSTTIDRLRRGYKIHVLGQTAFECWFCGRAFTADESPWRVRETTQPTYRCPDCGSATTHTEEA